MNRGIHLRMAAALSNDWGPLLLGCRRRVPDNIEGWRTVCVFALHQCSSVDWKTPMEPCPFSREASGVACIVGYDRDISGDCLIDINIAIT